MLLSSNSKKRLFFGSGKQKGAVIQPFFSHYHLSIKFLPFLSYTNTETLYTITETFILSRILPSNFRDNNRLLPMSIYYQAKQPKNNRSHLRECKNALKSTQK